MTTPPEPHLDPLALARLLRPESQRDATQLHRFVQHLIRGCEPCLESLRQLTETEPQGDEKDRKEEDRATDAQFEAALITGEALDRAQKTALEEHHFLAEEAHRGETGPLESQELRLESRASCELLLQQARKTWSEKPDHAVSLLQFALGISSGLDERRYGAGSIADLQAQILASLGNVRRIVDDHVEADHWFARALARLREGSRDPLVHASVHDLLASLRRDQQRFREAKALLDNVVSAYLQAGNRHQAGRALINQATVAQDLGEPRQALELLSKARTMLNFRAEPRLELVVLHNTLFLLADDPDEVVKARRTLEEKRHLYTELGDTVSKSRLPWLEGKIALAHGELDRAEAFLDLAREALLKSSSPLIWALASLDLAIVLALQMRFAEIEELARDILEEFVSRRLHQSTIATLLLLVQNAQARKITVEMLRATGLTLRRAPRTGNIPVA